jgi:hypothetical protein
MWLRIVMHRAEIRSRETDRGHVDLVRRRYVPVEQKLEVWEPMFAAAHSSVVSSRLLKNGHVRLTLNHESDSYAAGGGTAGGIDARFRYADG